MNWYQFGSGIAVMLAGGGLLLTAFLPAPSEVTSAPTAPAMATDKCDYEIPPIECQKPIVLPPLGPAIEAVRNEVWETRDGTIVQMNAPMRGDLNGVTMPEPIEIEGYEGSTIFEFLFWRTDGVNVRGESNLDLVKRRTDIKPHFTFDEDGYAQ